MILKKSRMFLVIFNSILYILILYLIISLYIGVPDVKNNSIGYTIMYLYNIALIIVGYTISFLLSKTLKISIIINVFINIINLFFVIFLDIYDSLTIAIWIVLFVFYLCILKKKRRIKF